MGKLVFRVASDWQEVVRLRTEIEKLKQNAPFYGFDPIS